MKQSSEQREKIHELTSSLIDSLSNPETKASLERLSKALAEVKAGTSHTRRVWPQRQRRRHRHGWVLRAVMEVMDNRQEPMRAKDVHAAVEVLLGELVPRSSVKDVLARHSSGPSPKFVRMTRGRYVANSLFELF